MFQEQYPYLYETHLHTSVGSACGKNTPQEMVQAAKDAGYTGIIITEHNWGGNTAVDGSLPWGQWVTEFTRGYYEAREFGSSIGLDVFWGYEAGFRGTNFAGTEYLIYGITPEWLMAHPEIRDMGAKEHLQTVRAAGAVVVHAHPYREASYIPEIRLTPNWVDAVEAVNAHHSNSRSKSHVSLKYDEDARRYAADNRLPITAGSDIHTTNLLGGGVAFRTRLESVFDYCDAILHDGDYILTNGEVIYDKAGNVISNRGSWQK